MISVGVIREWTTRQHKEHCQSTTGQIQAKAYLKDHLLKELKNYLV
jgi:hypothetical protein